MFFLVSLNVITALLDGKELTLLLFTVTDVTI